MTITGALLLLAAATATCPRPALAAVGLVLLGVVNVDEIREYLHGRGGRGEAGYLSERDLLVLAGVLLLAALIVAGAVGLVLLLLAG